MKKKTTSFAQMTKNQEINYTSFSKDSESLSSKSTWPSLGSNNPDLNLPQQKSQLTNGWLSTAKMCPALGRSIKAQGPPSPWSKNSLNGYENEYEEDTEYLPAPGYRESFFSAIDESLKVIDSKKINQSEAELEAGKAQTDESFRSKFQITKKKKKEKKLLFST